MSLRSPIRETPSKSLTSAAILTGKCEASKLPIAEMPDSPAIKLDHDAGASDPSGVTIPMPVTATRLRTVPLTLTPRHAYAGRRHPPLIAYRSHREIHRGALGWNLHDGQLEPITGIDEGAKFHISNADGCVQWNCGIVGQFRHAPGQSDRSVEQKGRRKHRAAREMIGVKGSRRRRNDFGLHTSLDVRECFKRYCVGEFRIESCQHASARQEHLQLALHAGRIVELIERQ